MITVADMADAPPEPVERGRGSVAQHSRARASSETRASGSAAHAAPSPVLPAVVGLAVVAVVTAIWVALTAATGQAYHLFPLVIGAAGAAAARYASPSAMRAPEGIVTAAAGLVGVGSGWLVLRLVDRWPSATFLEDQPGGLGAETIVFAVAGALIGLWYATRRSA